MSNPSENLAADYLLSLGYRLLERNWRYKNLGEIDLICLEGEEIVFVEVKMRGSSLFGLPEDAVDFKKLQKIRRVAEIYPKGNRLWRIDVVVILGMKLEHLKNVL